jgi:hypothetical protein
MDLYLQMAEAHWQTSTAAATPFCCPAARSVQGCLLAVGQGSGKDPSSKACGVEAMLVVDAGKTAPLYVVATSRRAVNLYVPRIN